MSEDLKIHIRPASPIDKDFIISLLPRLVEFGPPFWRDVTQMIATDQQVLNDRLLNRPPGTAIFIAEDVHGVGLGFIHPHSSTWHWRFLRCVRLSLAKI